MSSTKAFVDTKLVMPLIGLRRLKLGIRSLPLKFQPPTRMGDPIATAIRISPKGAKANKTSLTSSVMRVRGKVLLNAISRSNVSPLPSTSLRVLLNCPPSDCMLRPAAKRTAQVASSLERGISPSSRAFSIREGEASSVFSKSLSSDTTLP